MQPTMQPAMQPAQPAVRHRTPALLSACTGACDVAATDPPPWFTATRPPALRHCQAAMWPVDTDGGPGPCPACGAPAVGPHLAPVALDTPGRRLAAPPVWPLRARIGLPTAWYAGALSGTRCPNQQPPGATASLARWVGGPQAVHDHWPQAMTLAMAMRSAYLQRFPEADAAWTLSHVVRLCTAVLVLSGGLPMRAGPPQAGGALHPALALLAGAAEGVRLALHQRLFAPLGEPTLRPDTPMDAAEVLAHVASVRARRSGPGARANAGADAGASTEDFLAVLLGGRLPDQCAGVLLDDGLQGAVQAVEPALDRALAGLQLHAAGFLRWPLMARAYERLLVVTDGWAGDRSERLASAPDPAPHPLDGLRETLRVIVGRLRSAGDLAHGLRQTHREAACAEMRAQCARGLGDLPGHGTSGPALPAHRPRGAAGARQALRQRLQQSHGGGHAPDDVLTVERLATTLMAFFCQEQAVLRSALAAQARLSDLTGQALPLHPFGEVEVDPRPLQAAPADRSVPDLVHEFSRLLGARITIHPDAMVVAPGPVATPD